MYHYYLSLLHTVLRLPCPCLSLVSFQTRTVQRGAKGNRFNSRDVKYQSFQKIFDHGDTSMAFQYRFLRSRRNSFFFTPHLWNTFEDYRKNFLLSLSVQRRNEFLSRLKWKRNFSRLNINPSPSHNI